ncbi:MAG: hypothetical protein RR007_06720 [Kiritimatiellia bacterium]
MWRLINLSLIGIIGFCGCVRTTAVESDKSLRTSAQQAFSMGEYNRAKALIMQADRYQVPWTELSRRTLDLRIAQAENVQNGELQFLQDAWLKQYDRWTAEERADAQLTMIETLRPEYALDQLRDIDTYGWSAELRARYNLLFARLLAGRPELYDTTIAKWTMGIKALYKTGKKDVAAREAERCATLMKNANAALIAAKIHNELHHMKSKEDAILLGLSFSSESDILHEVNLIRSASPGTKSQL